MARREEPSSASHSLILRVRADGSRSIQSDIPDRHTFSARWISRELGRLCRVRVALLTEDGEEEYELTAFERVSGPSGESIPDPDEPDQPKRNWTGWECRRVESPPAEPRKRPWWRPAVSRNEE